MTFYKYTLESYNLKDDFMKKNSSTIGYIQFEINKPNFDHYVRTYQKIQSLLAEIMSVISLLFEIGSQISFFLLDKKMSKDIIRYVFYKDSEIKERKLSAYNFNLNKIFEDNKDVDIEKNKLKKDINKSNNVLDYDKSNLNRNIASPNNILSRNKNEKQTIREKKYNKVLKKINYFYLLKSYICIKDKKSQLINYCHNIISKYLSIEKIVEQFNKIEVMFSISSNQKMRQIKYKNKVLKQIKKYIFEISDEIKNEKKIKTKNTENLKIDDGIKKELFHYSDGT